jgi:hypothetical protein
MRRALGLTAVAAVLTGSGLVGSGGVAGAAPITDCTTSTGTIVAVDFAHWAGPIVRGCDTANPNTGMVLLHDAGFTTTGTQHDGPGFICRLGNSAFSGGTQYPTPAHEACVLTPPASAYWSYWLAPAGQDTSWTYSPLGVMSDHPKPGEIELWIFGATNTSGTQGQPSCTPASLRPGASAPAAHCSPVGSAGGGSAPPPKTSSSSAGHGSGGGTGNGSGGGSSSGSNGGSDNGSGGSPVAGTGSANHASAHSTSKPPNACLTAGASTSTSSLPRAASSSRSPAPTTPSAPKSTCAAAKHSGAAAGAKSPTTSTTGASGTSAGSSPSTILDAQPASKHHDTGSLVPVLLGVGLAAVLAGGTGFAWWRRRQPD